MGQLLRSQVRDTNNPAAQQQLTPEDILLMISRNKEKTRALLEDKKRRQVEEARAKIAKEAARLLRQANGRFRDARASDDPEKAARLRDEGEQRLADLESISPDAWPWAPWMYAVRDTELIIPESGAAPVYEGLRIVRPRAGAPDQLDYLEFGQIVASDKGEQIGLRAAGSPSWQVISYADGLLSGAPLAPENFPREGGPAWPVDDESRTATAIEKKIGEVFKYGKFEALGWRGASDAFLERYWPRFAAAIAEGLAGSFHKEKAPVTDTEGLAIAAGPELRGAEILPPTRAGWQRFLELAPKSGESFTALRDVGLSWWGRRIPQDLLSKERSATQTILRDVIAPRVDADPAYRNARANADEQNARIEHAQALSRVMVALLREDPETYGEVYRRYADDAAFRAELTQKTYDLTREGTATAPQDNRPRQGDEESVAARVPWDQLAEQFDRQTSRASEDAPEDVDERVIDNLFLQRAAMGDALAMAGGSKADRQQQAKQAALAAERITLLRAEASILRSRGYSVVLAGRGEQSFNILGRDGQVLGVRLTAPSDELVPAPDLANEARARLEQDVADARGVAQRLLREEQSGPVLDDQAMRAIWRRARAESHESTAPTGLPRTREPEPPELAPAPRPEPPPAPPPAPRPRAGLKAVRALEQRLVLPDTFTLDGQVFSDRRREQEPSGDGELRLVYTADARPGEEPRRLRLVLAPRDAKLKDIDLRAELLGTAGQTSARFDWETTSLAALGKMTNKSLADQLGVPVQPFADLPPGPEPETADPWEPTFERRFARGIPYRIARTRKSGAPEPIYTFAVYREDASPDRAIASFDLFEEDDRPQLVDLRWLEDIRPAEQERIRRQLDDAVRHIDHLHGGDDGRDPMALMVELLEQQTRTLRARKSPPPQTEGDRRGMQGLVALLQDLADPIRSPSEFQEYLEARGFPDAAATLSAYLTAPELPLSTLVSRLWSEILTELDHAVTTVDDRGRVRLDKGLLRTDARGGSYVLALTRDDPTAPLERIALPTPVHEDINYVYFERGRPLGPGALIYAAREEDDARYEDDALFKLHDDLKTLIDTLRRAPTYFADVRRALQLAGTLVDTIGCQGDSRKRTLRALTEAKTLYDAARRHLTEGRTAGALERIRKAMERIALAAVEIGRACAEGVQSLPGVETGLPVLPVDRAVLEGKAPDTTASALALLDQMRPEANP